MPILVEHAFQNYINKTPIIDARGVLRIEEKNKNKKRRKIRGRALGQKSIFGDPAKSTLIATPDKVFLC